MLVEIHCRCWDSNQGYLVLEATPQDAVPHLQSMLGTESSQEMAKDYISLWIVRLNECDCDFVSGLGRPYVDLMGSISAKIWHQFFDPLRGPLWNSRHFRIASFASNCSTFWIMKKS